MKLKRIVLLGIIAPLSIAAMAQKTHVIEPAILECRYESWQKDADDSYILRIGKTASQFFSYYRYRSDSLMNTSDVTMDIALNEFFESASKGSDRSKQLKSSSIGREWIYEDLTEGKLKVYSEYTSAYNTYEEDIPKQEWHSMFNS